MKKPLTAIMILIIATLAVAALNMMTLNDMRNEAHDTQLQELDGILYEA